MTNAPEPNECHDCGATVPVDADFCPDRGADRHAPDPPPYCSTCGRAFAPGDEFCADCARQELFDDDSAVGMELPDGSAATGVSAATDGSTATDGVRVPGGGRAESDDVESVLDDVERSP